jgi:CDP-diacylglycerol--inositol 3-phosphatidyltransferase
MLQSVLSTSNVHYFVPNVIGYVRIGLLGVSLPLMAGQPRVAMQLYLLATVLDALDGYFARLLTQHTAYGAALDMLTDRCATLAILIRLAALCPKATLVFQLLAALDVASHYAHIVATLRCQRTNHKNINKDASIWLRLYYNDRRVLATVCAATELFYVLLYLLAMNEVSPNTLFCLVLTPCAALCAFKQLTNVVQLRDAMGELITLDLEQRRKVKSQ